MPIAEASPGVIAAAEKEMVWASKRYGSPALLRELAAPSYDRACRPSGVGRQLGAMVLGGSRADALRELRVPTLVMHGLDDTLIDPGGGKRTADLVPGAKLLLIPGHGTRPPPRTLARDHRRRGGHPLSTRRGRLRPRFQ